MRVREARLKMRLQPEELRGVGIDIRRRGDRLEADRRREARACRRGIDGDRLGRSDRAGATA
jgi:hypothetical protein